MGANLVFNTHICNCLGVKKNVFIKKCLLQFDKSLDQIGMTLKLCVNVQGIIPKYCLFHFDSVLTNVHIMMFRK